MVSFSRLLLLPLLQVATAKVWLGMLRLKFLMADLQLTIITAGVNIGNMIDLLLHFFEKNICLLLLAGFDFGCGNTDGAYTASGVTPPLVSRGNADGVGQMQHFARDDGFNVFRLPVCWQYLVNNQLGATLDTTNVGVYDQLVSACLETGAYCVIDIHNYARWGYQIIGQSGGAVTNDQFASVWYQMYEFQNILSFIFFKLGS